MRINRNNYETFLVDFAEGLLSDEVMREVKSFLLLNPDIQAEFDLFAGGAVEHSPVRYDEKESLKKIPFSSTPVSSHYFQQMCVGYIEGLLPHSESRFFESLVSADADKKHELELFQKTKLPLEHLNFDEKLLLKRPEIIHKVADTNLDEYCVACVEGWLDQKGMVALNNYIAEKPAQKQTLALYYKTRVKPDMAIVYPDKSKIKRFGFLSPAVKKHVSMALSAAAVVTLAFMVFYTSTLDGPKQISGKIAKSAEPPINNTKTIERIPAAKTSDNPVLPKESVLHDPFGLEKISGKNEPLQVANIKRVNVNRIEPIQVRSIDCPPCKQFFAFPLNIAKISGTASFDKKAYHKKVNTDNRNNLDKASKNNKLWYIAQAGITGLNKFTNAELKVEKDDRNNKTRIAFSSRYFAFSTQVNRKN